MGFLQPLALFGLFATAIPPLLHLLARRLPPVVPFPAVRYLSETERRHSRRLKLRNLLLLLLRTFLILLIALAMSRPIARVPFGGSHEPAALGLLVDNSLSSGAVVDGRRVLDALADQARHVLDRAGDDDRLWLILADGLPRRASILEARAVLDTLSPWPIRLDLSDAIRAVSLAMADDPSPLHEVVVLSDLQATAFSATADTEGEETVRRVLAWTPATLALNRGVDSARVQPAVWSPSGEVVASLGGSDSTPTAVRLTMSDRDLARSIGGRDDRVVLSGTVSQSGWFVATVRLDPDELRADDTRAVAIRVAAPGAASSNDGAGAFLGEALAVLRQSGRVRDGADVFFSDDVATGVSVVFPPADPALIGALNRRLDARGISWQFGAVVDGEWEVAGDVGPAVGSVVYRRRLLEGDGDVLGRVGDDPWLVRDGNVILVASRMEADWSLLPISAAFVPFLDFMVNRVGAAPAWIVSALPGEVTEVPAGARHLLVHGASVPIPGNRRVVAPVERGVYFLEGSQADTIGALEVNHDPRETVLQQAESRVVAATLGGDVQVLSAQGLDRELFRGARRADLAGPLLMLAVLVALLEFGLSSAGGAARREP
ncbi:MAG: BatA domain-containing protein [Gemmatimonadetes bacterium]|nr:BatA domain-containing protein [Gemmatimonadota bacterium]